MESTVEDEDEKLNFVIQDATYHSVVFTRAGLQYFLNHCDEQNVTVEL